MAVAAAIGMGVVGAMGALQQGEGAKHIADLNADSARLNAGQARFAAREDAGMLRIRARYTTGTQRAMAGGSGIYVDSGSIADKITATQEQYEHDAVKALYNGELQATAFERQADLFKYQGKKAVRDSYFQAGFGLLASGTNAYTATRYGQIPIAAPGQSVLGVPANPFPVTQGPSPTYTGRTGFIYDTRPFMGGR